MWNEWSVLGATSTRTKKLKWKSALTFLHSSVHSLTIAPHAILAVLSLENLTTARDSTIRIFVASKGLISMTILQISCLNNIVRLQHALNNRIICYWRVKDRLYCTRNEHWTSEMPTANAQYWWLNYLLRMIEAVEFCSASIFTFSSDEYCKHSFRENTTSCVSIQGYQCLNSLWRPPPRGLHSHVP